MTFGGALRHVTPFRVLSALLLAWAITMTVIVAERTYAQWDAEALLFQEVADDFRIAANATDQFLITDDEAWAIHGQRSIGSVWRLFFDSRALRGSPVDPLHDLDLNRDTMSGILDGYRAAIYATQVSEETARDYLVAAKAAFSAIAEMMAVVIPIGVDPLAQLGEGDISSIRGQIGELCTLVQEMGLRGPGCG